MFTTEFNMYHIDTKTPVMVKIEQDDEVMFVSVDGNYLGSMQENPDAEFGYETDDEELKTYLESVSMHYRDNEAKHLLADLLMLKYGENLASFQFTNEDVLELIAHEDSDIEEFGNVIRGQIYDDVTFESKLSVVISKDGDDYTFNFDIN